MQPLKLYLDDAVVDALKVDAKNDHRDPRRQAEVIIRDRLIERGLLSSDTPQLVTPSAQPTPQAVQR